MLGAIVGAWTRDHHAQRRARTGNRVHRRSYYVGEREARLWERHNRFSRGENNARLAAAEEYDRRSRGPRAKNGKLGHIALEVYRVLLRIRGRQDGRLDPSVQWLARQLKRSVSAIHAALKRLRAEGFLDWVRRTVPVEEPEPFGPQVQQASNAYILELTGWAAAKVRQILRRPTEAMRRAAEKSAREDELAAIAAMTPAELAAHINARVRDPRLATALEGLSARTKRDSDERNV